MSNYQNHFNLLLDFVAALNGNATLKTSKEIAIIFDKLNCYRGDLLV